MASVVISHVWYLQNMTYIICKHCYYKFPVISGEAIQIYKNHLKEAGVK